MQSSATFVITDIKMETMSGFDVLRHVREHHRQTSVILITAYASVDTAVWSKLTSVVARSPDCPEISSDDRRGRAWLATREFDTHPSTRTVISPGVTIIPASPSYLSR